MKRSLQSFYPLFVFLFAVLLYVNTVPNEYNMDDELVTINHRTTSLGFEGIPQIFSGFYYEDEVGYHYGYRPITQLSFALEHEFFGESPHLSHAINVLLYGFLCLLIFLLIIRIAPIRGPNFALIVALVFAVHPIHTEVVASIKNRDEILSLGFGVLAMLTVLKMKSSKTWVHEFGRWLLAAVFLLLGFFSKNSIVSFFVILPLGVLLLDKNRNRVLLLVFATAGLVFVHQYLKFPVSQLFIFSGIIIPIMLAVWLFSKYRVKLSAWVKKDADLFFFALILYVVLSVLGVVLKEPGFCTWAFFLFVVLNKENIQNKTLLFTIFLGLSIFLLPSIEARIGLVVIYSLVYLGAKYFKPLIFLSLLPLAIDQYTSLSWGLIAWVLVIVPFAFSDLLKLKFLDRLRAYRVLLVSLVFISLLTQVERQYELSFMENSQGQEIALEQNYDRPILFMENPIIENWNMADRVALGLNTSGFYLKKLTIPYPLSFYYGYDQIELYQWKDWQTILSFMGIVVLLMCSLYFFFKRWHLAFLAMMLMLLSLLPYMNLFTPVAGIVGERLAFTASLGFAILLGMIIWYFLERFKGRFGLSLLLLGFGLSAANVINRNALWKNHLSLFEHDVKHLTKSAQANALYANKCMEVATSANDSNTRSKYLKLGEYHFKKAIEIYPDFFNWWVDLGRVYMIKEDLSNAKKCFEQALEFDSSFSLVFENLLEIAIQERNEKNILLYLNKLSSFDPSNIFILFDLSSWYYEFEKYDEVIKVNNQIINLDQSIPEAFLNKAYAYGALNDWPSFNLEIDLAEKLDPTHQDLLYLKDKYKEHLN